MSDSSRGLSITTGKDLKRENQEGLSKQSLMKGHILSKTNCI